MNGNNSVTHPDATTLVCWCTARKLKGRLEWTLTVVTSQRRVETPPPTPNTVTAAALKSLAPNLARVDCRAVPTTDHPVTYQDPITEETTPTARPTAARRAFSTA